MCTQRTSGVSGSSVALLGYMYSKNSILFHIIVQKLKLNEPTSLAIMCFGPNKTFWKNETPWWMKGFCTCIVHN